MSTPPESADGPQSPSALLSALRADGPSEVAELIGDVGYLLGSIAVEPEEMFVAGERSRDVYVNLLRKVEEARGILDALEVRTVVAVADATRLDQVRTARNAAGQELAAVPSLDALHNQADRKTRKDLSLMTRRSPSGAGRTLASARRLVVSMPHLLEAMATAQAATESVYAAADTAHVLEPGQCEEVDALLRERLTDLDGAGTRRWKQAVGLAIGELDPEGETVRHRRARKQRHVTFTTGAHGMATISAYLPAIEASLVRKNLSLEAERRMVGGEKGPHGALMADLLRDAVLRREDQTSPATLDVGVIITDRALFHPECGDVAQLEGYGPVPAEAVREQLRAITSTPPTSHRDPFGGDGSDVRAVIRRLYTHPTTSELVAMDSRARAFPPAMARFLTWRDTSCRGPFCNASIRHYDHIAPHAQGGLTSLDNGQGACAHCNQKEEDALSVERVDEPEQPGHRVTWTGYSGTTRITTAPAVVAPGRSAAPETSEESAVPVTPGLPEGPVVPAAPGPADDPVPGPPPDHPGGSAGLSGPAPPDRGEGTARDPDPGKTQPSIRPEGT